MDSKEGQVGWRGICCVPGVLLLLNLSCAMAQVSPANSAQSGTGADGSPDPVLVHRPPPKPRSAVSPEGRVALDVIVNDPVGKPVPGLEPWDFKLLDNDRPAKIMSFRSFGSPNVAPDPAVEVILLIDEVNLPFAHVSYVKNQIADFLRQNGGRLAQPTSIVLLTEAGLQVQPRPSTNGIALVNVLDQIKPHLSGITPAMGAQGLLERSRVSIRNIAALAENEAHKPGRKLLIWVGPGWPMLQSSNFRFSEEDGKRNFDSIVAITNSLRDARIVVYSIAPADGRAGVGPSRTILYQQFLKGVRTEKDADIGNLGLGVLATNTGGRVLSPSNDVAGQINQCIADANAFYRISFDPPRAEHVHEYHELKVQVTQPGLIVRTNAGYYNEPPGY